MPNEEMQAGAPVEPGSVEGGAIGTSLDAPAAAAETAPAEVPANPQSPENLG